INASFSAALNLWRIDCGTPAGAPSPDQSSNLYFGRPASAEVGVAGRIASRLSPATASAIALLAVIGPETLGYQANPRCTIRGLMGHRYPAVRAVYKMCGAAVHLRFSVASSAGPPEEYKAPWS